MMNADLTRYSSLDLRHLRLMVAMAEAKNLTSAARRLRLTTSALSHQLRHLETLANRQIFFREGKSMRPTPAGEMLIETARRVLEVVYEAEDQLRDGQQLNRQIIRLCAHCYTGYQWLPAVLRAFKQSHSNVEIRIVPEETPHPFAALREKRVDLVLSFDPPPGGRIATQLLFRDELLLLVSKPHRLATKRFVDIHDLAQEHLVMYPSNLNETYFFQHHLLPANVRPSRYTGVVLTEGILEMVRANLGVTVLARWAAHSVNLQGLAAKRLTSRGIQRSWYAATREPPERNSALAAFIEKIREDMRKMATRGRLRRKPGSPDCTGPSSRRNR